MMTARATPNGLERSLPRVAYTSAAFYEREQLAIFGEEWVYVGRAQAWAERGAYQVLEVGGESIIVIRGDDGTLRGHINLCRHRGSRLLCGAGTVRGAIRCPYHGWAYALDGTLLAAPFIAMDEVPDSAKRLHVVAVDEWAGFVFVNLAPERATKVPLRNQLGSRPESLSRYPLAALRTAKSIEYEVAANWKVILENYNECYHCAGVHPELCRIVPAFKRNGGAGLDWEGGIPHREGAFTFTSSGTSARQPFPNLDEQERVRHNGELIYPNFMLSLCAEHVAAFCLWPQGPLRTRIVCDFLFHPDEMQKSDFDPSDAVDFWDLVNRQDWAVCAGVQDGMRSRKFRFGYYAPMEDASLDIRSYIAAHMGEAAVAIDSEER